MRHTQDVLAVKIAVIAMQLMAFVSFGQAGDEPVTFRAYRVDHLPIWTLDKEGRPQFDAMVIVAYLKTGCEPGTLIKAANNNMLVVSATSSGHRKIREALERLSAFADKDVAARLKQALADATLASQRVLILVSDPNSDVSRQFFDAQFDDRNNELQELLADYMIQCVRSTDADRLKELCIVAPHEEESLLGILSNEGQLVATVVVDSSKLESQAFPHLLAEFLKEHRFNLPSARGILAAACADGARDNKKILVQVGGPHCGPCILLARYFEAQKELIGKDYVHVKLDTRMPEAAAVIAELRKEKGGIPWMAILSAEGQVLVTSDGENGNIGYPRLPGSRMHFRKMLETTSQHLTDAEIATLIDGLGESVEATVPATDPGTKR